MNKAKQYYFIDVNTKSLKVVKWGVDSTATHTGETQDSNVHRIFLTKGQYNKVIKTLTRKTS